MGRRDPVRLLHLHNVCFSVEEVRLRWSWFAVSGFAIDEISFAMKRMYDTPRPVTGCTCAIRARISSIKSRDFCAIPRPRSIFDPCFKILGSHGSCGTSCLFCLFVRTFVCSA
jgi:hypothetical protein